MVTDLSIVIVNYNGGPLLVATLRALADAELAVDHEVVVVDNASSDGSIAPARAAFPDVHFVERADNGGFSTGCNAGLQAVPARAYLLLNSDTEVDAGALEKVWHHLIDHPKVGIAAPRLVYPDGRDQKTARRFPSPMNALFGRRSPLTRLFPHNRFARQYMPPAQSLTEPFRIDWVSGACLMIRHDVVETIGGMDEGYFMYWEDADWCFRAQQAGFETWCVPAARVVHHEGGSSEGTADRLVWAFHESVLRFYRRNYLGDRGGPRYAAAWLLLKLRAALLVGTGRLRRLGAARGGAPGGDQRESNA